MDETVTMSGAIVARHANELVDILTSGGKTTETPLVVLE
jgi:hypothetical protein